MEDCNSNTPGGESGQIDPGSPGQAHWERAMELQGKAYDAQRDYGRNSPQARAFEQQAAEARSQAFAAGFTLTGQGQPIPGLDRRGGKR